MRALNRQEEEARREFVSRARTGRRFKTSRGFSAPKVGVVRSELGGLEQLVAQDFIGDSGGGRGEPKRVGVGPGGFRGVGGSVVFGERGFPIVGAKSFFRNGFRRSPIVACETCFAK